MSSRPDLPALLVAHKIGSAREVERALRGHADRPPWAALVDERVATPQQIFELLRDQAKFPPVSAKTLQHTPPLEILNRVLPRERALALGILVLELSADGKRAQLAMVDPTDDLTLRELARAAALQTAKVFVAERDTLRAAIDRAYEARAAERDTVEPAGKVGQRSEIEANERLERVLVQASLALGASLEVALSGSAGAPPTSRAREAARIAREVGRELGLDRRRVALVGLTAMLSQLDGMRRQRRGDDERTLFDQVASEVGWAGGGDDGLLGIARAITAQSAGFGRQAPSGLAQRVAQAVADLYALGEGAEPVAADGLDAVEQLLHASSAGPEVVAALMTVLRRDASERTPAVATALPEATRRAPRRRDSQPLEVASEDRTRLVSLPHGHSNDPSREG